MEATTADDDREIVDEAAEETDELADLPIGDVVSKLRAYSSDVFCLTICSKR